MDDLFRICLNPKRKDNRYRKQRKQTTQLTNPRSLWQSVDVLATLRNSKKTLFRANNHAFAKMTTDFGIYPPPGPCDSESATSGGGLSRGYSLINRENEELFRLGA